MGISGVGQLITSRNTGVTAQTATFTADPTTMGNAFLLSIVYSTRTTAVSSVASSNATWSRLSTRQPTTFSTPTLEHWIGIPTGTAPATVTVTWGAALPSVTVELDAQEFTAYGPGTTWALDGALGIAENGASTTITFPTMTAPGAGAGELYWGKCLYTAGTLSGGAPASFTFPTVNASAGPIAYNPALLGAATPTITVSASGPSAGSAILLAATAPASPPHPALARQALARGALR
ncbi:hypothetical protein [Pseudonocardia sp. T1-2H]|uniref:hypothetical protein n=1 Tax=Pseudonocardia sp. T1-2H TaxID=3128899 RepID=UPI003100D42C